MNKESSVFRKIFFILFVFCIFTRECIASPHTDDAIEWQSAEPWTEGWFPYREQIISNPYKIQNQRCMILGRLKASVGCFYPQFDGESEFVKRVNQFVSQNAKIIFCEWMSSISAEEMIVEEFDQEAKDLAFDRRELRYKLTPVYISSNFVSLFGETNRFSGLPHGSSRYQSFNFWWDGCQLNQVTLEQMVNCSEEFAEFLSSYCIKALKENQIGYFSVADEFSSTIDIQLEDCDVVTLSESGLTITFQPYKVGGWADGPYSVTVPFKEISDFITSGGPVSHFIENLN